MSAEKLEEVFERLVAAIDAIDVGDRGDYGMGVADAVNRAGELVEKARDEALALLGKE